MRDCYRRGNLESARAILEDIARYGGDDTSLVQRVRLIVSRAAVEHGAEGRSGGEPEVAECRLAM